MKKSLVSSHHEALLEALEAARVASVNVARYHGHIPPHVATAADSLLDEIHALIRVMRETGILGETVADQFQTRVA